MMDSMQTQSRDQVQPSQARGGTVHFLFIFFNEDFEGHFTVVVLSSVVAGKKHVSLDFCFSMYDSVWGLGQAPNPPD